ncbi:MAG: TIGR03619 family F420-dependent LLM class oxidoreductase [Gammaproteobacteria bacterium]|nr:TIGR03619 family F420-dependent LLM class oxidoreductase [Gammaproteobacteria bacterium]
MNIGMYVRVMGPQSSPQMLTECARITEAAGLDEIWVADHIAIPPDDAEGSDGRYLDPLATLAYLSAVTQRVRLGVGVLVLPYRPMLPTAKWVATVQELSGGRLELGVGVGWMAAEFRALGVDRTQRGRITDRTLAFLHRCFDSDEVVLNGQRFLFRPRPPRPPIVVGGAPEHAFERVLRYGDAWMPTRMPAATLAPAIADLNARMAAAGRPPARVVTLSRLSVHDPVALDDELAELRSIGVSGVVVNWRYQSVSEFARVAETLGARTAARTGD